MDMDAMDCKELKDLSVVCAFRFKPPADFSTAKLLRDCPSGRNGNFCLTTEVYRSEFTSALPSVVQRPPFQQQPPAQQQQPPVQQQPPASSVQLPFVGKCPSIPQATGMACARYV